MKKYIGVKVIEAKPMMRIGGVMYEMGDPIPRSGNREEGYFVKYDDGYTSFSPKNVFEKAYTDYHGTDNKVSQQDVDEMIISLKTHILDAKTMCVVATLKNGFTIVESSGCVDPQNFSVKIGEEICVGKIKDKVWFLMGFLLQCGAFGFIQEKGELK